MSFRTSRHAFAPSLVVSRMPNRNYSIITNFGCHYQCPYCITKQTGMRLPETDTLEVSKTVLQLIDEDEIDFLSFSGGGDPMHGILDNGRPTQRAAWYALLQALCRDHYIETEMHTSATTLYSYMLNHRIISLLREFDRLVYHCRTIADLLRVESTFTTRYRYFTKPIRAVFVVTPVTNATLVDAIERTFRNCPSIGELTFRQMVDGNFVPDDTLRDYLLEGHREGRWHYTEQDDYNRYIVNDKVYDRFEDIALAYSR